MEKDQGSKFKTLVFGASPKPYRYAHRAVKILKIKGYEVVAVGKYPGEIDDTPILVGTPKIKGIHTITLYVNPGIQKDYYDYFLNLEPKRIIFNPGTENSELIQLSKEKGIKTEIACTLVLLSINQYEEIDSEHSIRSL